MKCNNYPPGGDTGSNFIISSSGDILLKKTLDYETQTPNPILLEVTSSDKGSSPRSASVTVTLSVTDVNDNVPVCVTTSYSVTVNEDTAANTEVGNTWNYWIGQDGSSGRASEVRLQKAHPIL